MTKSSNDFAIDALAGLLPMAACDRLADVLDPAQIDRLAHPANAVTGINSLRALPALPISKPHHEPRAARTSLFGRVGEP
jgi:hypothetical protein